MTEPTDLIAPSALAKSLGIRMQSIYARVRSGQLAGYGTKPVMVSEAEARALMAQSNRKASRGVARGPRRQRADSQVGTFIATGTRGGPVNVRRVAKVHVDDETGEPSLIQASGGAYLEPSLLKAHLDQGLARYVSVGQVVGLILQTLVNDENLAAATSLELWADANGIEVVVEDEPDEVAN